jgi:hypothetical protein
MLAIFARQTMARSMPVMVISAKLFTGWVISSTSAFDGITRRLSSSHSSGRKWTAEPGGALQAVLSPDINLRTNFPIDVCSQPHGGSFTTPRCRTSSSSHSLGHTLRHPIEHSRQRMLKSVFRQQLAIPCCIS